MKSSSSSSTTTTTTSSSPSSSSSVHSYSYHVIIMRSYWWNESGSHLDRDCIHPSSSSSSLNRMPHTRHGIGSIVVTATPCSSGDTTTTTTTITTVTIVDSIGSYLIDVW
jgi:hypothetical protein